MAIYTCERCGKQFDVMGRARFCPDCRHKTSVCIVCGKEFKQKDPSRDSMTCSRQCAGVYRKMSGISKKVAEKAVNTKLDRYGDKRGYSKPNIPQRACKYCGKMFQPNSAKQVYCKGPHYGKCPACGKEVLVRDPARGPAACSGKCKGILVAKALNERGYEESNAKNKQTCLERYGVTSYSKTTECKERVKATNIERFGVPAAMMNPEIRGKQEQTCIEKYGVNSPAKVPEFIEKSRKTLIEKYGGMGAGSAEIASKIEATCLEKYGVKHASQTLQCKEAMKATSRAKYGFDYYNQSKERLAKTILDPTKIDDFWEFRDDPEKYVKSHFDNIPYAEELAAAVGVNPTTVFDILINKDCKELIDRSRTSIIEREVYEFLQTIVPRDKIIARDRKAIAPSELDFYLPEYKFAIECNPAYTHNSTLPSFGDSEPKQTVYHRNKTNKCEEAEIFLMHIFGYDWVFNRPIIESMIRSSLNAISNKLYARNTAIREVDAKTASEFLKANHRQGNASSPIRLGLFAKDTDELVAIMTFGKVRNTIGKQTMYPEGTYELVRFCNKLNTTVVGGASKLFKYFVRTYNPTKLISFSDRAHTKGNLYQKLGFIEARRTDPGYVWARVDTEEYKTRVACQKHNLPKMFDDVTEEDLQTKSERMIMTEHGYVQVFDSGNIVWEYNV